MSASLPRSQPDKIELRHTPTPWRFDGDWYRLPTIYGADGTMVAYVEKDKREATPERAANADLIVEAVNSYASLKSQVERMTKALRDIDQHLDNFGYLPNMKARKIARKALATPLEQGRTHD